MIEFRKMRVQRCEVSLVLALVTLIAGFFGESSAQMQPTLKVKLDVSPSVNISKIDESSQVSFKDELVDLGQLVRRQSGGTDSISLGPGFAVSAYENITVLVTVKTPLGVSLRRNKADSPRITCGYLNDGTTYFRRATITQKSEVEFRLRNNNLLKRSMKLTNPLFVAYVFFFINERKEARTNENQVPVSTVTVEFM